MLSVRKEFWSYDDGSQMVSGDVNAIMAINVRKAEEALVVGEERIGPPVPPGVIVYHKANDGPGYNVSVVLSFIDTETEDEAREIARQLTECVRQARHR